MAEGSQKVEQALKKLYRISEAGEKGFATASTNIHDPALKVLFKSFARQRDDFKSEISAEMTRLGIDGESRPSLRGLIHRGSFAIIAGLTIGPENQENVIIKEVARGEAVALKTYDYALKQELPEPTRKIVEAQRDQIRTVIQQIQQLRSSEQDRLLIHLFQNGDAAARAKREMQSAGVSSPVVETIPLTNSTSLYEGRGATTLETVTAGAFFGAILGLIIALLSGFGIMQSGGLGSPGQPGVQAMLVLIILAIILAGALVGAALAFFLGAGISEQDQYHYQQSTDTGEVLLKALVNPTQVDQVRQILDKAGG